MGSAGRHAPLSWLLVFRSAHISRQSAFSTWLTPLILITIQSVPKMITSLHSGRNAAKRALGRQVGSFAVLAPSGQQRVSLSSHVHAARHHDAAEFSGHLSFASPEADFTAQNVRFGEPAGSPRRVDGPIWSKDLSFSSPESDFTSQAVRYHSTASAASSAQREWSGVLSFASPENDWCSEAIMPRNVSPFTSTVQKLPRTFAEALSEERAAVVVTTADAPHNIVHVNRAWEEMCGYTKEEVLDRPLSMIQGEETNTELADRTVSRLLESGEPVDAYLVNYRKSGEKFTNHVSMGPLKLDEESPDVELLVGILEEVRAEDVPLRMVAY